MAFDSTAPAKPLTFGPDPAKAFAAKMAEFQAEAVANGWKPAERPKRSQLGSMFDEREDDHANTWVPRRHLLEG